jgi:hypothetical protein
MKSEINQHLPAEVYARVFENHAEGRQILDELIKRFGGSIYVKGGHEADRHTAYNAGRRSVLDFILGRINHANGVNDNDEHSDE